ncbi:DNA-binding transcriptional regulator, IclR family [Halopenitus malekzadehii]|uniref:DNA-binding transcriptional regulator, IclR family n=1 Tax=Halopenitus malekzadehii TaxID=1267564 RepID=A0A1H6IUJ2_9EURY|nr:IclR family transcriptional regulator [Halopenitus malekzadehii]SEH50119.1 DNA-binding transcriptional regulator, IclR family [Halopenitus malekzadehii]
MGGTTKTIGAVERAFEIIEAIERLESAGASAIADELSLSKSTAYTHLHTLQEIGYLRKEDGHYRLSGDFLRLGTAVQQGFPVYRRGRSHVEELADRTGERANLVVEERGKGTCVHAANAGGAADGAMTRGERRHMHATATGKALLAHLPEDRVDEIVETHGLPSFTDHTITSREALESELAEIRETGIAIDAEESILGLRCFAAPILVEETVIGSVSVSGPSRQFTDPDREPELTEAVRETANVIELDFVFG